LRVSVGCLGSAAQTGSIAGLLGLESMIEKVHILAARTFRGTRGTTEYAGARHAENEGAVECRVAVDDTLPAMVLNLLLGRFWSALHRFFF